MTAQLKRIYLYFSVKRWIINILALMFWIGSVYYGLKINLYVGIGAGFVSAGLVVAIWTDGLI